MKRHISIFAFLLCAFVANGPFAAHAALQFYTYGIQKPSGDKVDSSLAESYFSPHVHNQVFVPSLPLTVNVNTGTEGWAVDCWLQQFFESIFDYKENAWKQLDKGVSDDKSQYVFNERDMVVNSNGWFYVAVKFKYIPFDITFDGNGATSGSMDPLKNLNIDSPETALTPCKFMKTGHEMTGWSNTVYWAAKGKAIPDGGTVKSADFWDGKAKKFDGKLIAQWTPHTYKITCALGYGAWPKGYAPPGSATYDSVFSLSAPHRTGYDFTGWKVTSGLDTTTAKWGTAKNPATSIAADTLCVNGDKDVYFKNINPTDNASVTLTAQWKAKKITVTFNNHGGTSGGGLKDTQEVTYDATYDALNPPTKGGSLFLGYEIGGVPYWTNEGQPVKAAWDIPTNCTADAKWNMIVYQLTYNENRSDGTESKVEVRDFEYGKPTKLYDGADFSNLGCTLLGWSTNPKSAKPDDGCEIGGTVTFVESKTLYAVWEKNYFIAYDGNGATNETPMAVQTFVFGKSGQSLNPNTYGKVGYTFDDWATNRAAALRYEKKFRDKEVLTGDFATTVGETNTLYAIWRTNTYYVVFDPHGGTGTPLKAKTCMYDTPFKLYGTNEVTYTNGAYDFIGWSNDVEKVIYTDMSKPVSNLCAIANGTNTLYAVWKLAPLSAAMHCDNLRWKSYNPPNRSTSNDWIAVFQPGVGDGTDSCVRQTGATASDQKWLVAEVTTNGSLSFSWKPIGCNGKLSFWIGTEADSGNGSRTNLTGMAESWSTFSTNNIPAGSWIHIYFYSSVGICDIDQMTWTPGGPEPVDGKDNVTISSAAVSDGKFSLSFMSDAKFDYNLLTNANLLIDSWGVMTNEVGTGGMIFFEPKILEDQPQMFYKVETIQRK